MEDRWLSWWFFDYHNSNRGYGDRCPDNCKGDRAMHYRCNECDGLYCLHPERQPWAEPDVLARYGHPSGEFFRRLTPICAPFWTRNGLPLDDQFQRALDDEAQFGPASILRKPRCTAHGEITTEFPSCPHCGTDIDPDNLPTPVPEGPWPARPVAWEYTGPWDERPDIIRYVTNLCGQDCLALPEYAESSGDTYADAHFLCEACGAPGCLLVFPARGCLVCGRWLPRCKTCNRRVTVDDPCEHFELDRRANWDE